MARRPAATMAIDLNAQFPADIIIYRPTLYIESQESRPEPDVIAGP
jgi:hypothetical protein